MVKKAFFRANIPFSLDKALVFNPDFATNLPEGWEKCDIQGNLLLKHINTSFDENVMCFKKPLAPLSFTLSYNSETYSFLIDKILVYCFDTGIGIVSLNIPFENSCEEKVLVNTCSVLRCSAKHDIEAMGSAIFKDGTQKTYLSSVAEEQLSLIFGSAFALFNHSNAGSLKRIDMFCAALCEIDTENSDLKAFDKLCYRLSKTIDDRDKDISIEENYFCRNQEYTRWGFSKRGCAVVSNLTGVDSNDNFLNERWFSTVETNYLYLYLMILHQKYAIYNYLNTVAADKDKAFIKYNQESLIDFNSKYIFQIVSDEHLIQSVYLRMKAVNNINEVYTDLLDELKRMFDYSRLKNEESNENRNNKLNIISVIISIMCSITIVFDTISFFSNGGYTLLFGPQKDLFCGITVIFELLLFVILIAVVFFANKRKK